MTVDRIALGRVIEEAINDEDDTELQNVVNSFKPEELQEILKAAHKIVPSSDTALISIAWTFTTQDWLAVATVLQGSGSD